MATMSRQEINEAITDELDSHGIDPVDIIRISVSKILEERGWSDPLEVLEELMGLADEEEEE